MRIAIIGNSGSGKSTLALRLAQVYKAAVLDLDTVAWEPDQAAVARAQEEAEQDVQRFCSQPGSWIVEGCYAGLVKTALQHSPYLLFLDPGLEQCISNCRNRPWEPHKYPSKEEQDEHLAFLLNWVADYYSREGDMSHHEHQALFHAYAGPKLHLDRLPGPEWSL